MCLGSSVLRYSPEMYEVAALSSCPWTLTRCTLKSFARFVAKSQSFSWQVYKHFPGCFFVDNTCFLRFSWNHIKSLLITSVRYVEEWSSLACYIVTLQHVSQTVVVCGFIVECASVGGIWIMKYGMGKCYRKWDVRLELLISELRAIMEMAYFVFKINGWR